MVTAGASDLPLTLEKNIGVSAQESAIKYHFFHGQWSAIEDIFETVELPELSDMAQAILGIAIKFHLRKIDGKVADGIFQQLIDRGFDQRSLRKLITFDTYITSARAELLLGSEEQAEKNYREAFSAFAGEHLALHVESRLFNDLVDLDCLERATEILQSKRKVLENTNTIKIKSSDSAKVILVAGMRHSGSTALFNLVRIGGLLSGLNIQSGYSEQVNVEEIEADSYDVIILKTHEKRDDIFELADVVLTTRRDLRDTVASGKRREFNMLTKLGVLEYAKYNRTLHDIWSGDSDYEFVYEDFIKKPEQTVESLFSFLGLDLNLVQTTLEKINNLPTDQYKRTLLSPAHITDKDRKLTFKDSLSHDELEVINKQHGKWLQDYGYHD